MRVFYSLAEPELHQCLAAGGVAIVRTDTLYGMVACAANEQAVEKVYELKHRAHHKSSIVLISSLDQLYDTPNQDQLKFLGSVWPGPVSVVLASSHAPLWIRRDNGSVAYRMPAHPELQALVQQVGPLIAPSANPEGEPPAANIKQATSYFGDGVDAYVDGGDVVDASASTLLRLYEDGTTEQLR